MIIIRIFFRSTYCWLDALSHGFSEACVFWKIDQNLDVLWLNINGLYLGYHKQSALLFTLWHCINQKQSKFCKISTFWIPCCECRIRHEYACCQNCTISEEADEAVWYYRTIPAIAILVLQVYPLWVPWSHLNCMLQNCILFTTLAINMFLYLFFTQTIKCITVWHHFSRLDYKKMLVYGKIIEFSHTNNNHNPVRPNIISTEIKCNNLLCLGIVF